MPRKLAWAMGSAFTRLGPLDSAIQFVEGGECRFGQREDADRQRERRSFCQIRGRKSGIIGFWGRVTFHGRAVRANDRRRRDLTFLEGKVQRIIRHASSAAGATANRSHLRGYRPGHRSRKRYLRFKSRGDLELIKVTLRL